MSSIRKEETGDVSWVDHACSLQDNVRIYLTELCNSRCMTCNFWKNKNEVQLDTKTWQEILQRLRSGGISALEFVGGEPTVRPDLTDLIKKAKELGYVSIRVSSNGILLNDSYITELIRCGVNGFNLSLDGLRETYEYIRGGDWFENTLSAIGSLAKAGMDVLVLTNLTRQVIGEMEVLVDLIHRQGAHWSVNIIENLKYGFAGVNLDKLSISSSEDIEKVVSILARIKQRYPSTCILRDMDILYVRDYLYDPQRESKVPCALGFRDIYLDPKGNVFSACMSMNPVGNILERKLPDIIQSAQMKSNLKAMLLRQCQGCTCGYSQRAELMHGKAGHELKPSLK
jgi:MoaA/NifB/PqqE/SkfB family radical SAM enzyme